MGERAGRGEGAWVGVGEEAETRQGPAAEGYGVGEARPEQGGRARRGPE